MKQDGYNELINNLIDEKEINDKKINYFCDKMKKVRSSRFENKVLEVVVFSLIGYLGLFLILFLLVKCLGMAVLVNTIPILGVSAILGVSSLGIGNFLRKLIDIGSNINKDYISKTEVDKLSDEVYHQMELAKVSNRNVVINRVMENVELDYSLSKGREADDEIIKKVVSINDFEMNLDDKYQELDTLVMKEVLSERFKNVESRFNRICSSCTNSTIFGIVLATLFDLVPTLLLNSSFSTNFLNVFIVGMISSGVYNIKNNLDYVKVLNKLKTELNISNLSNSQELVSLIEKQINDISDIEFKVRSKKDYLNNDFINNDDKSNLFSYSFKESFDDKKDYKDSFNKPLVLEKRKK